MGDLLPVFGVSFVMWLIIRVSLLITFNIYFQLLIGICVGVVFYLIAAKLLLKSEWNDTIDMLPNRFKR